MEKAVAVQLEAARQLAQVALRFGSVAVIELALDRANSCRQVFDNDLFALLERARNEWSAVERTYGAGAALNLEYNTVCRMRAKSGRSSDDADPILFSNADRYRASPGYRPHLYPEWLPPHSREGRQGCCRS